MGVHRSSSVYSGRSADILSGRHIVRSFLDILSGTVDPTVVPAFSEFSDYLDFKWHMAHSTWHMAHGHVSSHSGQFVDEASRGPLDTIFLSGFG